MFGKFEGNWPLKRYKQRWKDNINMGLKEIGCGDGSGCIGLRMGIGGGGCCEWGNEHSCFIKFGDFLD